MEDSYNQRTAARPSTLLLFIDNVVELLGLGITDSPRDRMFKPWLKSMDFSGLKSPEHKSSGKSFNPSSGYFPYLLTLPQ